ncbi:hypothetical protein H5410_064470 [Solanum commersonii]|uniref:Uncharacterized protein n=1 Tax=Solanum commersonii TaxID=4109 RepID=A0A9J5VZB8_SOLCO|nr:hypothetical protein H5410_064470 [Solanum commersonii]
MGKGILGREALWGRRESAVYFWKKKKAIWDLIGVVRSFDRTVGKVTYNVETLDWRGCCNVKACIRLCKACNVKPPACRAVVILVEFGAVRRWSPIGGVVDEVRLQAPVGGVILKES